MRRFKTSPDESYEKVHSVNVKRITLNNSLITGVDFAVPERSSLVKKNNQLFQEKAPIQLTFSQQIQKKQRNIVYIRKGNSRNKEKGIFDSTVGRVCGARIERTIALHGPAEWINEKIKIYSTCQPRHEEFHLLKRPYFMGESITLQRRIQRPKQSRIPKIYQSQRMQKEDLRPSRLNQNFIAHPLAISPQSAKMSQNQMISPWHDLE